MQIPFGTLYGIAFAAVAVVFMLYVVVKTCSGGPGSRSERRGGVPREGDLTSTSAAYGSEVSYLPGTRASSAGPFPVEGKQERPPTRSFSNYTNPRREEKEEE